MTWIASIVVTLVLVAAIAVLALDSLIGAVVATSVVSLGVSVLFVLLLAPDVALTEAAIGAGLSSVVLALALRRLGLWRLEGDSGKAQPLVPTEDTAGQGGDKHA